jgi:hypothetical protein
MDGTISIMTITGRTISISTLTMGQTIYISNSIYVVSRLPTSKLKSTLAHNYGKSDCGAFDRPLQLYPNTSFYHVVAALRRKQKIQKS